MILATCKTLQLLQVTYRVYFTFHTITQHFSKFHAITHEKFRFHDHASNLLSYSL